MRISHTPWLACPKCGSEIEVEFSGGSLIEEAVLRCAKRHR